MLDFKVVKRQESSKWGSCLVFIGAIACSLTVSGSILALTGRPPVEGLILLFQGAFSASYTVVDTIIKTVPIFLCSLGVAITFRMQVWNIGAEGQYALGAVGATWAALTFPGLPIWLMLPLMLVSASVAGGIWAYIPALLKIRLKVNEIITTLMFNYIAVGLLDYLIYGPWKDARSHGFPMTRQFQEAAVVPGMFGTRIHLGVVLCVLAAIAVFIMFHYMRIGYELKASGSEPRASHYAHMPYGKLVVFVMVVCGALAGWGGFMETSAVIGRLQPGVMAGYGYTAIVVAWLARLNPLYIGVASFLLAALRVGVENLQLEMQVPAAFGGILEGTILLSVLAGQFFQKYRIVRRSREVA